jgi:hypothetical protein
MCSDKSNYNQISPGFECPLCDKAVVPPDKIIGNRRSAISAQNVLRKLAHFSNRLRPHSGISSSIPTRSSGVISTTQLRMNKNSLLNQIYICPIGADGVHSHVQRESGDWIINTLMLEGYDVPFKYKRKSAYKNLEGARVNLTYYSETKSVSGVEFETMKVVL